MTILFEKQWLDYPNAIIDITTKNKSFLRIAALYKSMGIKNHAFMLQLHDKDLQGVDPFDPNLSTEMMVRIALECKSNFFYFIREVVRVPGGSVDYPIQFRANRGNMALYWLFFNHITAMLIQIRQTGKSLSNDMLATYLLNIRCTNTSINLLTKDDTLRSANLERLKNIELELPFYLKQRGKGDIGNTEELSIKSLNNSYRGHLPNKSPKMALNVCRGITSGLFILDEAAFFYNIGISLPAALAAGTAARDLAKMKNEPYGTIITTTAGKKDDRDGAYIYNMLCNSAIWTEKFFDCKDLVDLELTVRNSSPKRELRVNCTFNHRQLGYTDEWLRNAIESCNATGDDASRDFGNCWTSGSQSSPLSVEQSDIIRESQQLDFFTEISSPYSYITRWFIPEDQITRTMANGTFIMSLDTSDAAGGDDIALSLRDVKTGAIIATGNYNETNLITFAEWICQLLITYLNVTLIIERRSTGAMILDYLLLMLPSKDIDPFARIYNKAVQDKEEYPDRYLEISKPMYARSRDIYTKYKKLFGFATSATGATSRTELYSVTLLNAAKITGDKVKDPKTIDQILGLIIKNGRVDHADGGNDDMVIAWLLNFWILIKGKNLSHYGINSRDILVDNAANKEVNNPMATYERKQQELARGNIERLIEDIKNEPDDYIVFRLECSLRTAASSLKQDDRQILSVDNLINELRENRKINRRKKMY